jgi:hypothetical protein
MVTHDNIHIPSESFPHWIWFVIEFAIVLAVSALLSREITGAFENLEEVMGLYGMFVRNIWSLVHYYQRFYSKKTNLN